MTTETLKHDFLGTTRLIRADDGGAIVERDTRTATPLARPLARRLAAREVEALTALAGIPGVPRLLGFDGRVVRRTYAPGRPLYEARPRSPEYFLAALRLLRRLHRAGIVHNDLAKEANWLVADGDCVLIDFQLATRAPRRTAWFRRRAYDDLRHLLKHKRTYQPERLTTRQRRILATPSLGTRAWRALAKPLYRLVTRILLGWPERLGPAERQRGSR